MRRQIRNWCREAWPNCLIFIRALILLNVVRIGIVIWKVPIIRRTLLRLSSGKSENLELSRIVWGVETAKRFSPGTPTCLVIALTTEALCKRYGYNTSLKIGARRLEGKFEAHAWLEKDDKIVVGGPIELVTQYTKFASTSQS